MIQERSSYFIDMGRFRPLDQDEVNALIARAQDGDREARNLVLLHNGRLLLSIASRWATHYKIDVEELIGLGALGMIRAVEKYDPTKGMKFSSYATLWIEQFIRRHIQPLKSSIQMPGHYILAYRRMQLLINSGASEEEAIAASDVSERLAREILKRGWNIPARLEDMIPEEVDGDWNESMFGVSSDLDLYAGLRIEIDKLPRNERFVMLAIAAGYNYREIGERMKITSQRVAQIQESAVEKLRRALAG